MIQTTFGHIKKRRNTTEMKTGLHNKKKKNKDLTVGVIFLPVLRSVPLVRSGTSRPLADGFLSLVVGGRAMTTGKKSRVVAVAQWSA